VASPRSDHSGKRRSQDDFDHEFSEEGETPPRPKLVNQEVPGSSKREHALMSLENVMVTADL
jgi:hypothetical protein